MGIRDISMPAKPVKVWRSIKAVKSKITAV
jgi:hypothetical protein